MTEKQIDKMDLEYEEHSLPTKVISFEGDDNAVLFKVLGGDPEAGNAEKDKRILEMDEQIQSLSFLKNNTQINTIILHVSEATFLRQEDGFKLYSKKYTKKGTKLNIQRFEEHYSEFFNENFAGKTIIYLDWGW